METLIRSRLSRRVAMACFGCSMRRSLTYILALAELIACMLASRAFSQSCALYATDFGAFSGPPDLLDGEFRVLWCPSGASITSSNFCHDGFVRLHCYRDHVDLRAIRGLRNSGALWHNERDHDQLRRVDAQHARRTCDDWRRVHDFFRDHSTCGNEGRVHSL